MKARAGILHLFGATIIGIFTLNEAAAQVSAAFGLGAGVVIPQGDYAGTTLGYYAGSHYGLSSGFTAHGKVRLGLIGFNLAGEISYSSLSNKGESEPGQGRVEVSHHIIALKAGPEFHLNLPAVPVTPYLGAGVSFNMFSGKTMFQGVSKVSSGTFALKSSSRFGLEGSLGLLVKTGGLNLDFAVHYALHNLVGKSWEGADSRIDTYTALNDDKDPAYVAPPATGSDKHVVKDSRSIQTLSFTVTIMFGI